MSEDPFITIKDIRVRKSTIKKYETKPDNAAYGKDGVLVFLFDGKTIVDWNMTVEDMDKLMELA